MERLFTPLGDFLMATAWPVEWFKPRDLPSFLASVYVVEYRVSAEPGIVLVRMRVAFEERMQLAIPGLEGTTIAFVGSEAGSAPAAGSADPTAVNPNLAPGVGSAVLEVSPDIDYVYDSREPDWVEIAVTYHGDEDGWRLTLHDLTAQLRFSDRILRPVDGSEHAFISLRGSVVINDAFDVQFLGFNAVDLSLSEIGHTGFIISANGVKLDLDRSWSPPEVIAAGLGESFIGVFMSSAQLTLPPTLPALAPSDIVLSNCAIGSGGFTGALLASYYDEATQTYLRPDDNIGGLPFRLKQFVISLKQSALVEARMSGQMKLPFFDRWADVALNFDLEGHLSVELTGTGSNELKTLTKQGLLEMSLESIRFELDAGVATIRLAGKIKPLVGGLDWPAFDVDELSIDTEGRLSVTGGWIDLPKGYTLNLHAFKLEITKFGCGRDDSGDQYLGFNGALDLVKGIPAGASVEGLRITWGKNKAPSLSLKRVGVELTIPDTLHFKGEVSYESDGDFHAFTGSIKLELPALKGLALDGKIVFGSRLTAGTRVKYFAIFIEGEFAKGIPLGTTGLDLKGVAGLFSVNYAPDKPPEWMWHSMDKSVSWFHKPPAGVTDIVKKWAPQAGTLALGAGVQLETSSDSGYIFNGKFLLLLLLPGPVIMIDGRANLLQQPTKQKDAKEPMFHALAVLDVKAGYFLLGLDAKWKYDGEQGKLVEIAGSAETFFDFNDPRNWRIYLGKRDPLAQRIQATFAAAFQANAYFMLDPRSLALGVWIGKQERYKLGPVKADLEAWLEANALLSFRPAHLHADLWLHGLLGVKVFKWGFAIGLDARLAADVSKPFHILGTLVIKIETRFKDFEIEVRLEWGPRPEKPEIPLSFKDCGIGHLKTTAEWPLLPNVVADLVPVDGRPYITFEHPVHDAAGVCVNPAPDPGWMVVGNPATGDGSARVRYRLTSVALERFAAGDWVPVPKLYGAWGAGPPNPTAASSQNRLMLYAKSPFELTDDNTGWNPWLASNLPSYPCPIVTDEEVCIDWEELAPGTGLLSPWVDVKRPGFKVEWGVGVRGMVVDLGEVLGAVHGLQLSPLLADRTGWQGFIASGGSGNVYVVDTTTDTVSPIKTGLIPRWVAVTPDGSRALVVNGGESTVRVIDTTTMTVTGAPIPVRPNPYAVAITPDGAKAFVVSGNEPAISVIDLATLKVVREIKLAHPGYAIAILPNGTKAYVSHPSAALSVIDVATESVGRAPIPAAFASAGSIVIAPDVTRAFHGTRAYIARSTASAVAVFDTALDRVVGEPIRVGVPLGIAISPDGSRLYTTGAQTNDISVVDTASRKVFARIPVGPHPQGIAVTPDGARVYVGNGGGDTVTVIDAATNRAIKTIGVGKAPVWVVFSDKLGVPRSTRETTVLIDVPPGSARVDVLVYHTGSITGEVVDPVAKLLPSVTTRELGSISHLRFVAAELGLREGIRRIRIRSEDEWILIRVCSTRPALAGGLGELAKLHESLTNGLSVWGEPGAVLEPSTEHRLRAHVDLDIEGLGKLGDWRETRSYDLERTFKTGEPPGLGELKPEGVEAKAVGLEDLTRYVAQTIPSTLAPPGERPQLQRPVYRGYDFGVDFNEDYVDRMYELAGRDLAIRLHDSGDLPVRGLGGGLLVFANQWGDAAEVKLTETRRRWLEVLDAASCLPHRIDPETLPQNKALVTADHVLEPDTLYEARLVPLLLRAPQPGGARWKVQTVGGVPLLKRVSLGPDEPVQPAAWTDVLIQVTVQPLQTALTGVAFRFGGTGHYLFGIDAQNGRRQLSGLATPKLESPFAYDATKTYRISIEAIGKRLRVEQDGELVFDVEDAKRAAGSVGLFPWAPAGPQRFLDLSVHDFRKGAPVAYRFPFTTSRYVDFFHQVHSFTGQTWLSDPSTPFLPGIIPGALSAPPTEDEARGYDNLTDVLLGAGARQLAPRLEATRVVQGVALLVRSDEPLLGPRTTLTLAKAAAACPTLVPPGRLKVTGASFGAKQPGGDVVHVLLQEALDPTGCRIEALAPATPLRPAVEPPLFVDRFAQDNLAGWELVDELPAVATSVSSSWSTGKGKLRLLNTVTTGAAPEFRGTFAAAGESTWTDVALTVHLRCPGGGAVGVVVRRGDNGDYYRFSMDSKLAYRQLVKKIAGHFTVLWRDSVAYDPKRTYELTLVATGSVLRGYLDGAPLFLVSDDDRPSGIIALYVWNGEALFSGVRVDPIQRSASEWLLDEGFEAGASERWSFSRQGAPSPPWQAKDGALLAPNLGTGNAAKTGLALAGDLDWADYRLSAHVIPGATGAGALVFRHQDGNRYYALWMMPGAKLRLARIVAGKETFLWKGSWSSAKPGATLLTIDCIGPSLTGYANGRRLFRLRDDAAIDSGRIGFAAVGKTGMRIREVRVAAPVWTAWSSIEKEQKRAAGTRLEVHAGAIDPKLPPAEPGTIRTVVPSAWKLPAEGVTLRLVDGPGKVEHALRMLPADAFVPQPFQLMRNADGTGFVVATPTGSDLTPGTYRLGFTYERKKAGVTPNLSRSGSLAPEHATLDVSWPRT